VCVVDRLYAVLNCLLYFIRKDRLMISIMYVYPSVCPLITF